MKKVKTLGLVFGGFICLILILIITLPFFIDVDKYRPQIISIANEQLNGKLELGKLKLSLWGKVKVEVNGLKLVDAKQKTVLDVNEAAFELSFFSLLHASPELQLVLNNPKINIIKQQDGKLNALALIKTESRNEAQANSKSSISGQPSVATTGVSSSKLPSIVMATKLTFLINGAQLHYTDLLTKDSYNIDSLDLSLKEVSLSRKMPFELKANLDLRTQKKIQIKGPLVLNGDVEITASEGKFEKALANVALSLKDVEILDPGNFHKKPGTPLGLDFSLTASQSNFDLTKLNFIISEIQIASKASGTINGTDATIHFVANSNKISLSSLSQLIPSVPKIGGTVELVVRADGPTSKLDYGANLKFNGIELEHETLKQPLKVNGFVEVETDQIKKLVVKLSAKKFNLTLSGMLQSFSAPRFKFTANSDEMNLDELLKSSEKAAEERKEAAKATTANPSKTSSKANAPIVDYNSLFNPLRENKVAAAASGTFDFDFKKIVTTGVAIESMKGQFALNRLLAALQNISMQIFGGKIGADMTLDIKSSKPRVGAKLSVAGLDTQKMVENQMPLARNTIKGIISADMNVGGNGLNQSDIIDNWKGKGTFAVNKAVFSTLDIGKQIRDGVFTKLPDLVKSKLKVPDNLVDWRGEYEVVSTKFSLDNGMLKIEDITGKAYPNKGLDAKGSGHIKLNDYALDLNLDLVDKYNWLKGDEIAKDPKYGHFALALHLGGTLFSPKYDWGNTVKRLAENAAKQHGAKALQNVAGKVLGDKAKGLGGLLNGGGNSKPEAPKVNDVKNALKGLFGR